MKKRLLAIMLSTAMVAALTACGSKEETSPSVTVEVEEIPVEEESTEEETEEVDVDSDEVPEGMYRSELTNLPIDESLRTQRPVAVMVDNESFAWPHYGIAESDVVYELMNSTINGRITRLMCIIKDWGNIEQMGSIRSVRPTNILLAVEWNAPLCHDGGPFYIDPYFANDYTPHFSGVFSRVNNGKATEYTEYIVPGDLDKAFSNAGVSTEYDQYYLGQHYEFNNPSEEADLSEVYGDKAFDAKTVELPFPHTNSKLIYNEDTQTYDYGAYDKMHTDAEDNEQLTFKNVLLQKCSFTQYDENGYLIYNCIALNQEGYYLTDGKAIPVRWSKAGDVDIAITRYFDEDGNLIKLNTGKTYVSLIPDDSWDDVIIK